MSNKKYLSHAFTAFISLAAAILLLIPLFSCEIGLGSAVDTEAPTATITYPSAGEVVRGPFQLGGACHDDKQMATVSVKITNLVTKESYKVNDSDTLLATLNTAKTSWSISVNAYDAEVNTAYNGYPLPDGTYKAEVWATDASGRTSQTHDSLSFEVDNTAPIFILNSPGITDIANPTAYGSLFKVTGTIADDHNISSVLVTVYNKAGKELLSYESKNVETAGGTTVTVAKNGSTSAVKTADGTATTLGGIYSSIYSQGTAVDKDADTHGYYCTVKIFDSAVQRNNFSDSSKDETTGNATTSVYLYDTVYAAFEGSNGYGLAPEQIKKIVNGTFPANDSDKALGFDAAKIAKIKSDFLAAATNTVKASSDDTAEVAKAKTPVAFSLNPDANPKYTVTGYTITSGYTAATPGQTMTVVASAGRDGINVSPKTLKVYLFGPYSVTDAGTAQADIYANPLAYSTAEATKAKLIQTYSNADYKSSSVETYAMEIKLPEDTSVIQANSYYIIAADGYDVDGLELDNGNTGFGFKGAVSGTPPDLTVTSPADGSYAATSAGLVVTGTADSEAGIDKVTYAVNVTDSANNDAVIGTITGTAAYVAGTKTWSFDISQGTGYSACAAEVNSGKAYRYYLTVTALSNNTMTKDAIRSLYIDTVKPVIDIQSVTPVVDSKYVNGTITVTGSISDTFFKEGKLTATDGTYTASADIGANYKVTVDTTKGFTDGKDITVTVTASDKAGNTNTANEKYTISQDTDRPVVAFTNAEDSTVITSTSGVTIGHNLFDTGSNNKLTATVSDDDGIESIIIKCTGQSDKTVTLSKAGTTSQNISYTLPAAEGKYTVTFVVTDTTHSAAETPAVQAYRTTNSTCYLAVDKGAPVFNIKTLTDQFVAANTAKTVTGEVSDFVSLKRYSTNDYDDAHLEAQYVAGAASGNTITLSGTTWTDIISAATVGETAATKYYEALDAYGNSTRASFAYKVDKDRPTFTVTSPAVLGTQIVFNKGNLYEVSGTVNDNDKVGAVYYKYVTSVTGIKETAADSKNVYTTAVINSWTGWTQATVTTKTDGTQVFSAPVNLSAETDGTYYILIAVKDDAGNISAAPDYVPVLVADSIVPVVTITKVNGTAAATLAATYKNGQVPLTVMGTVTDANYKSFTVTAAGGTFTPVVTTDSNGAAWTVSIPAGNWSDLKFTATDACVDQPHTASAPYSVTADALVPSIDTGATGNTNWLPQNTATVSIKVKDTGDDGSTYSSGITSVTYTQNTNAAVEMTRGATYTTAGTYYTVYSANITLASGENTIKYTATDAVGNSVTTAAITYKADTAKPAVTSSAGFSNIGLANQGGTLPLLTITASDADSGLASSNPITLYLDGAQQSVTATDNGSGKYTIQLTADMFKVSGAWKAGTYKFKTRATDAVGNYNEAEVTINADFTAPVVKITSAIPTVMKDGHTCVNGSVTVSGSVTETDLADVIYKVYIGGDTEDKCKFTSGSLGKLYTFTKVIDTTEDNFIPNTTVKEINIVIIATDAAGNTGTSSTKNYNGDSLNFYGDQSTDNPVISSSNASVSTVVGAADIKSGVNLFDTGSNKNLIGTISDDDGLASYTINAYPMTYSSSSWNASSTASDTVTSAALGGVTTTNFTYKLPSTEGRYKVVVEAKDSTYASVVEDSNHSAATVEAIQACRKTSAVYYVGVDAAAPALTVTNKSGAYAAASGTLSVTGTASDSCGLASLIRYNKTAASVDVSADTGTSVSVATDGAWTDTVSVGTADATISYFATDVFGKVTSADFSYKVDSRHPSISITTPASLSAAFDRDNLYTIEGKAYDNVAVSGVYWKVLKSTETAPASTSFTSIITTSSTGTDAAVASGSIYSGDISGWNKAASVTANSTGYDTQEWTAKVNLTDTDGTYKADGTYTVYLLAIDGAGNRSVVAGSAIALTADKTPPAISSVSASDTGLNYSESQVEYPVTFTATLADATSGIKAVELVKNGLTVSGTVITPAYADAKTAAAYTIKMPKAAFTDGSNIFTIKVTDNAGNSSTHLCTDIPVDSTKPVVTLTGVTPILTSGSNTVVNGTVTLTGKVTEANLNTLTYTVNINGTDKTTNATLDRSDSGDTHTFTLTLDTTAYVTSTAQTPFYVLFTATDSSGNTNDTYSTTTYNGGTTLYINQGTDIPVLTISNADTSVTAANIKAGSNLFDTSNNNKMLATVSDDDGIKAVSISLRKTDDTVISSSSPSITEGTTSASFSYILPSTEGKYKVVFTVTDTKYADAGSTAVQALRSKTLSYFVGVDKGAPTLTIGLSDGIYTAANNSLTIPVTALDTGGLATVTCDDNTSQSYSGATAAQTWSKTVTTGTATKTYTFTATDIFSNTTTATFTYNIDDVHPMFTVTTPASLAASFNRKNLYTIEGKAYDNRAISKVYYLVQANGSTAPAHAASFTNIKQMGTTAGTTTTVSGTAFDTSDWSGWTAAALATNASSVTGLDVQEWTAKIDLTGKTDGKYDVYVAATDSAGNRTMVAASAIVLTADETAPAVTGLSQSATGLKYTTDAYPATISATIGDATSGLDTIVLVKNNLEVSGVTINPAFTSGATTAAEYTFSIPKAAFTDGDNYFTVKATDKVGLSTTLAASNISVDSTVPVVAVTGITPVITSGSDTVVNGTVTLTGKVTEAHLKTLTYTVTVGGTEKVTNQTLAHSDSGDVHTFSLDIDTTTWITSTAKTAFAVAINASDDAGNISAVCSTTTYNGNNTLYIDQGTDIPVLTVSNASDSESVTKYDDIQSGKNLFDTSNNNKMLVSITDDDGVPTLGAAITIYSGDSTTPLAAAQTGYSANPYYPTFTNGTTSMSFGYKLPSAEGAYKVVMRVQDTKYADGLSDAVKVLRSRTLTYYVAVDNGAPVFSAMTPSNGNYFSSTMSVGGTVTDGSGSITVNASGSGTSGSYASAKTTASTTASISDTVTVSSLADECTNGYTITYTATDKWGQSSAYAVKYYKDATKPAFSSLTIDGTAAASVDTSWFKNNALSIVGEYTEAGSGVDTIYYWLKPTDEAVDTGTLSTATGSFAATNASGKASYKTAISGFAEYTSAKYNTFALVAVDKAGNASAAQSYTVRLDQTAPVLSYTGDSTRLTNKKTAMVLNGTYTEAVSGVPAAGVVLTAGSNTITATVDSSVKTWTATISAAQIAEGSVTAKITDNAGNSNTSQICTIQTDTTAPVVAINSALSRTSINGKKNIEGSVTESSPASLALYYSTANANAAAAGDAIPSSWKQFGTTVTDAAGIYNFSFADFDFTALSGATGASDGAMPIYILAVAMDKAGNCSVHASGDYVADYTRCSASSTMFIVKLDGDRPVVKMAELTSDGSVTPTVRKYSAGITGTVSDDDGIAVVKISDTAKTLAEWQSYTQTGTLEYSTNVTSTSFSYTPDAAGDGTHAVYIYIKDTEGTEFYTNAASGVTYTYRNMPNIQYSGSASTVNNTGVITYLSDSNQPTVGLISYGAGTTADAARTAAAADYAANKDMPTTTTVGGTVKKYLDVELKAEDAGTGNGIASVKYSFDGITYTAFTKLTADTYGNGTYYCSIDASAQATGSISLNILVTDNSGLTATKQRTVVFDNEAPNITVTSPLSGTVTGEVEIRGTTTDTYSKVSSIKYLVMNNTYMEAYNTLNSTYSANSSAALITVMNGITTQYNSGTAAVWDYVFDGADHSGLTNALLPSTVSELSAYSNITHANDIYTLPVYFLVTDELGNSSLKTDYTITYNPFSDRPNTYVLYPAAASGAYKVDLSGTIRVSGSADDNVSVDSVYVQIAFGKQSNLTAAGIETMKNSSNWDSTAITGSTALNTKYPVVTQASLGYTGADFSADSSFWGIKAGGSASWYLSLNSGNELQTTAACDDTSKAEAERTYTIWVRAAALDNNHKLGSWSAPVAICINPSVPSIGSSVVPYIIHYNDAGTEETGRETYKQDMYLKGNCSLVTSIEHKSGIQDVYYKKGASESSLSKVDMDSWAAATTWTAAATSGYTLTIPLEVSSGAGTWMVRVEGTDATDNHKLGTGTYSFNYDNIAPTLDTLTENAAEFTAGAKLNNINNMLVMGGTASDANSGFNRLMFYFYRDTTGYTDGRGRRIYDTQFNNKTAAAADYRIDVLDDSSAEVLTGITADTVGGQPMYGVTKTITSTGETSFTIPAADSHIRSGGLVRIGSIYYLMTTVSDTSVSLAGSYDTKATSAFFPFVQVVDNTGAEKINTFTTTECTFKSGDDGDGMPETVTKAGATWAWDATLHANYMPDGPITFVCFVMDKSGNIAAASRTASIETNPPRLSKVFLGTDLSGNGKYADNEFETYDMLGVTGSYQEAYDLKTASYETVTGTGSNAVVSASSRKAFTIKDTLAVVPELTGGNGTIKMVYTQNAESISTVRTGSGTALRTTTSGKLDATTVVTADPYVLTNADVTGTSSYTNTNDGTGKKMAFSFWDSTEELTQGSTTQSCFLRVTDFTVDVTDGVAPKSVIAPFFWNSASQNSLYGNSGANGHIELAADWKNAAGYSSSATSGTADADPKVSGKITLRGYAYDDVRLGSLWAYFGGVTAGTKLTTATNFGASGVNTVSGSTYYEMAEYSSSTGAWTSASGTVSGASWKFTVYTATPGGETAAMYGSATAPYFDQNGHKVFWQLDIDTSGLSAVAAADIYARVIAVDHLTGTGNSSAVAAAGTAGDDATYNVPLYKMDVVPYITGIKRNNSYNTYRTRSGGVALLRGETLNTITGFNLANLTNTTLSLSTDRAGTNVTTAAASFGTPTLSGSSLQFTVPDAARSGYLQLKVNSVAALNNVNGYKTYNTEDTTQLYDRTTLSDDRYVQIWRVNAADTFKSSSNAVYPAMAKATDGTLFASFSNYSSATVNYASFAAKTEVFYTYDPPEETDLCVTGSGTGGQVNVLYSANYQGGTAGSWTSDSNDAGGLYCYDDSVNTIYVGRDYRKVLRFELFYHNQMLQQFKNFRVKRAGTAASDRIHVAYYDKITNSIHYSNTVEDYSMDATTEFSWVNIDGGTDSDDSGTYSDGSSVSLTAARFTGTTRCTGTGDSVALALTSTKYPVIVYYDASNGVLKLARASATNPKGNVSKWTVQDVLGTSDPNYGTQVSYISAEIDSSGYLHIAFQNMKNQLVYIKSTNAPTNGTTAYTFGTSQTIDDSGTYIDLALNGTTPYISYLGRINSYDGMKIAYYDSSLDFNNDGTAEGGWETMTAPLNQKVTNVRSCIETQAKAADSNTYAAAIGFYPGADYRAAFFVGK